jgi:hypothetical protein
VITVFEMYRSIQLILGVYRSRTDIAGIGDTGQFLKAGTADRCTKQCPPFFKTANMSSHIRACEAPWWTPCSCINLCRRARPIIPPAVFNNLALWAPLCSLGIPFGSDTSGSKFLSCWLTSIARAESARITGAIVANARDRLTASWLWGYEK